MVKTTATEKPLKEKKRKKKTSNVPQQYLGFSLQSKLFLLRLLESESGTIVSLEVFDDVGVELLDGTKTAVQMKSVTSKNNPIRDHGVDLWKTFSNWVDAVINKELNIESTYFEIYVTNELTAPIVQSFHEANSEKTAKSAIAAVKSKFFKNDLEVADKMPNGIQEYLINIYKHEDILSKIVERFTFKTCKNDIYLEIERLLKKIHTPYEIIDRMIISLLGWVTVFTDKLIIQKKPACISHDEFHIEYIALLRASDLREMLSTLSDEPNESDIRKEKRRESVYIQQIELIDGSDDDKITAISDYLRSATERTLWAQRGWIHRKSFLPFEENLKRIWKNESDEIQIVNNHLSLCQQGNLLYIRCRGKQIKLAGRDIPSFFVPGCYHVLSDHELVGWHPEYRNNLKKIVKKEENEQ